jgi:hypothetical protein
VRCRGLSLRVCVACCASLIADCRSELRWSVRDARLYWRPPFKSPFFDPHQFGGCWGGVSLALVLNSGELVGGVSFPAPVLLCVVCSSRAVAFAEAAVAAVA